MLLQPHPRPRERLGPITILFAERSYLSEGCHDPSGPPSPRTGGRPVGGAPEAHTHRSPRWLPVTPFGSDVRQLVKECEQGMLESLVLRIKPGPRVLTECCTALP